MSTSSIGSTVAKTDQRDLTAVVSSLFPPRSHKAYLRQTTEPIYYDNVHDRVPPLPPKKQQRNVISYVEVFGQDNTSNTPPPALPPRRHSEDKGFGSGRHISFDGSRCGAINGKSQMGSVTPDFRRFYSERNGLVKDYAEELCEFTQGGCQ